MNMIHAIRAHHGRTGLLALLATLMLTLAGIGTANAQIPFAQIADGQTIPAVALTQLQAVSKHDIGRAPAPENSLLKAIPKDKVKSHSGKPWVIYIGAEYCPYCAAMRWPLVLALMRFGHFTGLTATRSSSTDVYPDTATFSFVGSHYSSPYLDFDPVEIADREGKALETPNAAQKTQLDEFDRPPYTESAGVIPFLALDGRWVIVGSPVSPGLFKGLGWYGVATHLEAHKGPLWQAILGEADRLTARFCTLTHGQPKATCSHVTK